MTGVVGEAEPSWPLLDGGSHEMIIHLGTGRFVEVCNESSFSGSLREGIFRHGAISIYWSGARKDREYKG